MLLSLLCSKRYPQNLREGYFIREKLHLKTKYKEQDWLTAEVAQEIVHKFMAEEV